MSNFAKNKIVIIHFFIRSTSIVIGIIIFVLSTKDADTKLIVDISDQIKGLAYALLSFIVGEFLSNLVDTINKNKEHEFILKEYTEKLTTQNSEEISKIVNLAIETKDSLTAFITIPYSKHAIDHLLSDLKGATLVKNTYVGSEGSGAHEENIEYLYHHFFQESSPASIWKDLISYRELFEDRFRMSLSSDLVKRRHHVGVLKHNIPLINFTIIYRENNKPYKMYFGWTYHRDVAECPIYYTTDSDLMDVFSRYYDHLWQDRTLNNPVIAIDYNDPFELRFKGFHLVDKRGTWLTYAYREDDGNIVFDSWAILEIKINDRGNVEIRGTVFNKELNEKHIIDAVNGNVYVTPNRAYFEYNHSRTFKSNEGFCMYHFQKRDKIDHLEGWYINKIDKIRTNLIGVKINSIENDYNIHKQILKNNIETSGEILKQEIKTTYGE